MIDDCHMTPCGHVFCKDCLLECVNRNNKCPSCNAVTRADDVIKNKQADRVADMVQTMRDSASKAYFEKLIGAAPAAAVDDNLTASQKEMAFAAELSPIEQLFRRHMQQALGTYNQFLADIGERSAKAQAQVKQKYVEKMESARRKSLCACFCDIHFSIFLSL